MTDGTSSSALDRAWARQSIWSQVAGRLKADIKRSRTAVLGLSIGGAVLAALAVVVGVDSTLGLALSILGATSISLVPVVRARASQEAVGDWTRARSVAETLKSEVYLYLARAGAYAADARHDELAQSIDVIEQDASDMLRHAVGIKPAARQPPAVTDVDSYVAQRVNGQLDGYYRPQAATQERLLGRVRAAELTCAGAGAILAAVAGATGEGSVAVWVPVATTLSAAVTAHAAAERHEFLLVEYLRTAAELERLCRRLRQPGKLSPEDFVRACERVISLQNEGWMAKLTSDPESAG